MKRRGDVQRARRVRGAALFGSVAAGALIGAIGADAAEFRLVPRLEVIETYTDNVRLSPTNRQEDFVTTVAGGASITAESRKLQLSADYTGKYLIFLKSDDEDFRSSARAALNFDVIDDYFSIRADGFVDQQFVNRRAAFTFSDATLSDELQTVKTVSVEPELTNRFGTFGRFDANYRVSYTDRTRSTGLTAGTTEGIGQDARVALTSGERFGRLRWQLFGQLRDDERRGSGVRDFSRKEAGIDLSYAVLNSVFVEGSVGIGDTNFTNVVGDNDGIIWNAGLRLQPNRRLSASVRYGKRFRNDVFSGSLTWEASPRTNLSVRYSDRLTTSQQVISDIGSGFDPSEPFPPDTGVDPDLPGFTLTDSGFRRQRLSAALNHDARRWNSSLRGFFEKRDFERAALAESDAFGGQASFTYQLGRHTDISLRGLYRHDQFSDEDRDDDTIIASLSLSHTLSSYLTASLTASRADQQSNTVLGDAREHSVRLLIRGTF